MLGEAQSTATAPPGAAPSGFSGPDRPLWDDYSKCIHCGLCLNHCPTYRELGVEMDSPRGRIYQMIQVDEGRMPIGDRFVEHIDLCLDCRACETACPSKVQYGRLVEAARAQIEQHYKRPLPQRLIRWFVFRHLLGSPALLKLAGRGLWLYAASGLQHMVRRSGLLEELGLADVEALAPAAEPPFFFEQLGRVYPAQGKRRFRVALFAGCIANISFARLNEATARVLAANGCEVVVPRGQGCCGALHVHAGVRDEARRLARRNIDAFLAEPFDAFITNAAGCGSTLKEYHDLLAGPGAGNGVGNGAVEDAERAEIFSEKMKDSTEFLAEAGLTQPLGPVPVTATYQDPCHLGHGQRVRAAPRELIAQVPGLVFRELPQAELCCGSAGIYNVQHNEMAMALLEEKMEAVNGTGAEVVLTANPGCLLQLRAGVKKWGAGQRVWHVVELLDRSARAATRSESSGLPAAATTGQKT